MTIDARGLACPEPVVRTQKGIVKEPAGVTVLVDNPAAVENITRFATAKKYAIDVQEAAGEYTLTLKKA